MHTEIDFGFDEARILTPAQMELIKKGQVGSADIDFVGTIFACGAPNDIALDSYTKEQGVRP